MKKKVLAIVLCIAMLAIAVAGGTLAYFTDNEQATNEYTIGSVEIDLYETAEHVDGAGNVVDEKQENLGKDSDDATNYKYNNILPGDTMTKVVTVENTGKSDAYIALAVKQENYGNFNANIDDYYEGMTGNERYALGLPTGEEACMIEITGDIFAGSGWGLDYTKTANSLRYMMKDSQGTANGTVEVLGYGYSNVTVNDGKTVYNYNGDIFNDVKFYEGTDMDGNFDSLKTPYTRMWVIYLKVAPGASYTVDLTTVCPTYIDNNSVMAFENMVLDVKAFAIQTAGFATAKDAFAEVFKAEDCFAY